MINLLPDQLKANYHYSKRNVSLLGWTIGCLIAIVGVGMIATYGLLKVHQSDNSYSHQVTTAQNQLNADNVTKTEATVKDISSTLKLAVKVLSNELLFSKLIQQIGAAMPNGTILTALNINQAANGSGLNLSVAATDYQAATQTQVNLAAPTNGIFSKVDIISIDCSGSSSSNKAYPCQAQLRAQFNSTNQFLFINQGAKK